MSPRKSSTSSGRPAFRPRYLGVEVAGEPLPPLSLRAWEALLLARLIRLGPPVPSFRVLRAEGRRAVVRVGHRDALRAREAWSASAPTAPGPAVATFRTWGTLLGAKAWLGRPPRSAPRPKPSGSARRAVGGEGIEDRPSST